MNCDLTFDEDLALKKCLLDQNELIDTVDFSNKLKISENSMASILDEKVWKIAS
jgi:hypothetical protein